MQRQVDTDTAELINTLKLTRQQNGDTVPMLLRTAMHVTDLNLAPARVTFADKVKPNGARLSLCNKDASPSPLPCIYSNPTHLSTISFSIYLHTLALLRTHLASNDFGACLTPSRTLPESPFAHRTSQVVIRTSQATLTPTSE